MTLTDNVVDLYQNWLDSEFNIFGNAGATQADFNSGTEITVSNTIKSESGVAINPSCTTTGYTGETNNLNLNNACSTSGSNGQTSFIETNNAMPTISTSLSSLSVSAGGSVYDTATLSGETGSAGGTVTYDWYFASNTCSGGFGTNQVTVSSGTVPNSQTFSGLDAGPYSWQAVYSGDSNNLGATSTCEPLTVSKAAPGLSTSLSSTNVNVGVSVSDTATVSGGYSIGGSLTFFESTTNSCPNGGATQVGPATIFSGDGGFQSSSMSFSMPGTYYWYAIYGGDGNNNAVTSACEPLIVGKFSPSLGTSLSTNAAPTTGSVSDVATITGGDSPSGSITFFESTTNSCPNGGATQVGSSLTVSGNGAYTSSSTSFSGAGSYYWYATYSGDTNNNAVTSACEPLSVQTSVSTSVNGIFGSVTVASPSSNFIISIAGGTTINLNFANVFKLYVNSGDIDPSLTFDASSVHPAIDFGPGGSGSPDYSIFRSTAGQLGGINIQSLIPNTGTVLSILPNGASNNAYIQFFATSDYTTNYELLNLATNGNYYLFQAVKGGNGQLLPILFEEGSTPTFEISPTGIANQQGLQSVINVPLTNGAKTTTVTMSISEPNSTYGVTCTSNFADGGLWVTSQSTTQFVINTTNSAGPSSAASCIIIHQ